MQLFYSPTSPYARKARVTLREKDLRGTEEIAVDPYAHGAALLASNPLSKVPALILDDGTALYDSPVICEYLDSLSATPRLLPAGEGRWACLRRAALCDGIIDATYLIACETLRRPENERSAHWVAHWYGTIDRGLEALETEIAGWGKAVTLAHVAAGCALAYVDLRAKERSGWRLDFPTLAAWEAGFAGRPSMQATRPG